MEDESFAQPSITSLGLEFIWNNSSSLVVVWKHTTHRKPGGGGGGGWGSRGRHGVWRWRGKGGEGKEGRGFCLPGSRRNRRGTDSSGNY